MHVLQSYQIFCLQLKHSKEDIFILYSSTLKFCMLYYVKFTIVELPMKFLNIIFIFLSIRGKFGEEIGVQLYPQNF